MTAPPARTTTEVGLLRAAARRPAYLALAVFAIGWVFFVPNYWIFTASSALVLSIAALGLMVLVGWAREVSLAQAALVGSALYISAWLYRPDHGGLGWPFPVAALVTIVAMGLLSALVSLVSVRLSGVYVMVLTVGLQFTLERMVFSRRYLTGGQEPFSWERPWFFGIELEGDRAFYFFLLGVTALVLLLMARLRRSRYGRSLLFMGSDRRAAAALGISPWRYKMFAFGLCGMLAGLAGVLFAALFEVPPIIQNYSSFTSLYYLSIPVLAGFESLLAVVLLTFPLSLFPQWLQGLHINTLLLGGLSLVGGTLAGARGLGGVVMDRTRKLRRRDRRQGRVREGVISIDLADADKPRLSSVAAFSSELPLDERRTAALAVLESYLPPREDAAVALTATDVSLHFGGVTALSGVSISVPTGQLVGLIGPNGAGKSTLFDVVNGLKRPDSGDVWLFGQDVTRLRAWDRCALGMSRTFQANRINLELSVRENLLAGAHTMIKGRLPGLLLGLGGSWAGMQRAEEAAWAVAELFEIEQHWDELAGALSFGNRRRVEIGRSLMAGPRLLLLDEPAAGLDPAAAAILFSLVKRLHRDLGLTVLLVEHYVRAVLENCDLIYVLSRGELVASGTATEVANHPDVRSQYLGLDFEFRSVPAS